MISKTLLQNQQLSWSYVYVDDGVNLYAEFFFNEHPALAKKLFKKIRKKKLLPVFQKKITRYCFRTLIPPWKPKVTSEQDMRYFSPVSRRTRNWNTSEEFSGWDENFWALVIWTFLERQQLESIGKKQKRSYLANPIVLQTHQHVHSWYQQQLFQILSSVLACLS